MLGHELRLPGELLMEQTELSLPTTHADYIDNIRTKLKKAHEIVRKNLQSAMERQQDRYDSRLLHNRYKPGDLVWYRNDQITEGVCLKLQPTYQGPCLIMKNYGDIDYLVQKKKDGRKSVTHHNRLKPYEGKDIPRWIHQARKQLNDRGGLSD